MVSPLRRRRFSGTAWLATLVVFLCATGIAAQTAPASPPRVRVWEDTMMIPTSEEGLPDPNPPFDLFNSGRFHNYPYTLRHNLKDVRTPRAWRTLNLENEYLKCVVLPDLGGHLYSCTDKINSTPMFYANPSIKFARIAYRGMWAALGVEFNFPVSHNWMTVSPVDFAMKTEVDGSASVLVGNIDRVYGMQWRVQLTLRPGCAYVEQQNTIYNLSETRHRFYWWTNAGVQVWDDSRILYPMRFTAGHGFADINTWPVNLAGVDQSVVGNHKYGPVSRFSYGSREPYMAVYHPRTQSGIVHYSSPLDMPSKKIWSWGNDEDGLDWRTALSDNKSAYVEIQAGLFRDQETYGFLEPEESRTFSEYWIPIRGLGGVSRANREAVLNLNRQGKSGNTISLEVVLNVTRDLENAELRIMNGQQITATVRASLSPRETWRREFPGLPSRATYRVELRDNSGKTLLQHTEGEYDFADPAKIHTGKQAARVYPAEMAMCADDYMTQGTDQESEGELPVALKTYQRGLARYPDSIALNRAAGRLEVSLKQYANAEQHLSKALEGVSSDHETAYYLGLALASQGEDKAARPHWEFAQQESRFHAPALLELAALESREGRYERALETVQEVVRAQPDLIRAGGMEVSQLRALGRQADAKERVTHWMQKDPTSSLLRYEATRLGASDATLMAHLAADPERILEIAADYMQMNQFKDALDVLSESYPSGPEVVSEPGAPHPSSYPLIAYYRGYCLYALGQDGRAAFDAASNMPTRYVFPHRPESFQVLRRAVEVNPEDATAYFLLGSLYLSGAMPGPAMEEWEITRSLKPATPGLQRNMGYTVLRSGGSPERAVELFREGTKYDPRNVDVYLGLEEAMERAGRPASERVAALEQYPDLQTGSALLVFRLVQLLEEKGEFDQAEKFLTNRFFAREEGGANVREVYISLKLKQAKSMAAHGQCGAALGIVDHLEDPVASLPFTENGLASIVSSDTSQQTTKEIRELCH
jgi:tetratricopeptide (TPR) repeat protein